MVAWHAAWKRADLSQLQLVYGWADGLYVKAGICGRIAALLVIVGASASGEKMLLACEAGERESKQSWCELLRDLKQQGLNFPRLMVADGHRRIWATLTRDWELQVSFFDYPQEHGIHLRTTNIVESPFHAVRRRTDGARRLEKVDNAGAMIWKLLMVAQKSWRALNAPHLMRDVYDAEPFKDGVAVRSRTMPTREAA